MLSSATECPRGDHFEAAATDLAGPSLRHGRASGSGPQRARPTARCTAPTGESPPWPNRPEEAGSGIDTAWLDDWIFLLPLWRVWRSPVIGPATLYTADNEPSRRVKDCCDETSVVLRGTASRMPSGSAPIRNALMRRGDFQPNDRRRPASIQRAPYRRDLQFSVPPLWRERRYRAHHECRYSSGNT